MAKKRDSKKSHTVSGKFILISFAIVIIIGAVLMTYLFFSTDRNHQEFYEIRDANENYLIENQNQIMQAIDATEVDEQELGYIFIPEYPATYIDLQSIPQHNVPYLNQNDSQWADKKYGTDGSQTIWENGCAIVVLAMVDSYFQSDMTRPEEIVRWAGDDYYLDHQGTSWSIYQDFGMEYGYEVVDVGNDFYSAMDYVNNGYLVVVSVGPGTFTDGGHVMLIRGYQDGLVYVNDPNDSPSKFFSIQGISAQTVINNALNYWAIAPY